MKRIDAYGCDQCQVLNINGVNCHETGCVNQHNVACEVCDELLRRHQVYYANDWDGIKLCKDCAERQAQYEEEDNYEENR